MIEEIDIFSLALRVSFNVSQDSFCKCRKLSQYALAGMKERKKERKRKKREK